MGKHPTELGIVLTTSNNCTLMYIPDSTITCAIYHVFYEDACCKFIPTMNVMIARTLFSARSLGGEIGRPGILDFPNLWRAASVT